MSEIQAACNDRGRDDLAVAVESLTARLTHHVEGLLAGVGDIDLVSTALDLSEELEGFDNFDNRVVFIATSAFLEMRNVQRPGDWLRRSVEQLRRDLAPNDPDLDAM